MENPLALPNAYVNVIHGLNVGGKGRPVPNLEPMIFRIILKDLIDFFQLIRGKLGWSTCSLLRPECFKTLFVSGFDPSSNSSLGKNLQMHPLAKRGYLQEPC